MFLSDEFTLNSLHFVSFLFLFIKSIFVILMHHCICNVFINSFAFLSSAPVRLLSQDNHWERKTVFNPSCFGTSHLEKKNLKKTGPKFYFERVRDSWSYITSSLVVPSVAHSEPWSTSMMELFVLIANGFKSLTKFAKDIHLSCLTRSWMCLWYS